MVTLYSYDLRLGIFRKLSTKNTTKLENILNRYDFFWKQISVAIYMSWLHRVNRYDFLKSLRHFSEFLKPYIIYQFGRFHYFKSLRFLD